MCAERLNFTPTALTLYRRAIAESKRQGAPYPWAYLNLAKYYREDGEDAEALQLLEEAESLCPEANTLTVLAQMVASNDPARAEKLLRRATELDASLPDAHYRLSLLLRGEGRTEAAHTKWIYSGRLRTQLSATRTWCRLSGSSDDGSSSPQGEGPLDLGQRLAPSASPGTPMARRSSAGV